MKKKETAEELAWRKNRIVIVKPSHSCGAQGFDPMKGDTCPGCEAEKRKPIYVGV